MLIPRDHWPLSHARPHRVYALFHLMAFRGLRRGEACGLRWTDLDLENGIATVCWQIVQLGWDTDQGQPKSEAGERQVVLDAQTITVLRAHKKKQNQQRLAKGNRWVDSGMVFTTEDGSPLHPAWVSDQFQWLAYTAGLPPIRLHDLRHGAATLILAAGHDMKVVQETLGLSSITIAADTYTSVLPELARQAAEDTAALVPLHTTSRSNRHPMHLNSAGFGTPDTGDTGDFGHGGPSVRLRPRAGQWAIEDVTPTRSSGGRQVSFRPG